ncbi:MAG: ubiquinol-cytochrome C chaperone family protein [Methylovirgula sp.]
MIFGLFRGSANRKLIDRLHRELIDAARDPVLFTDYGIADTLEGRFEALVLHGTLVLRRLEALPLPGPEIAQDLADTVFRHFDIALRELGVADTRVPKEMKALAEAFGGRGMAYHAALQEGPAALAQALSKNVYGGAGDGEKLAHYVIAVEAALAQATLPQFVDGPIPFPKPERAKVDEEARK